MHPDVTSFKALIEQHIPFNKFLGIELLELGTDMCKLYLPYGQHLLGDTRRGAIHGGVISTLIDTCGGFTVWSASGITDRISTIDMRVDYLKPALECSLIAHGTIRLLGNRVGNTSVTVYAKDHPETILAEGRAVYNIRKA